MKRGESFFALSLAVLFDVDTAGVAVATDGEPALPDTDGRTE